MFPGDVHTVGVMRRMHSTWMRARAAAGVLAVAGLTVSGCASDRPEGEATVPAPATSGGASTAGGTGGTNGTTDPSGDSAPAEPSVTPTATATFPPSPVGQRMQWFVGQIGSAPVEAQLQRYFDTTFLQQATPEQLYVLLGQLRTQGPWTLESVTTDGGSGTASLVSAKGRRYTLSLTVTPQGLIDGAAMRTAPAGTAATTWPAVQKRLAGAAKEASVLAVDLDASGRRTVVHRSGSSDLQPISSLSSLYVLAAVADEVAAGRLTWDRRLPADVGATAAPSTTPPTTNAGTVRDLAEAMIARADTAAADTLTAAVGERAILAAAKRAGNTRPEGITPFLTHRQVAWLAWGATAEAKRAREQWQGADAARRRALVAPASAAGPAPAPPSSPSPHWPKGIGWFATPDDVVSAHVRLQELGRAPATAVVRDILGRNGGIDVDGWDYTAFKGGSDTGAVALSFYAEAGTGQSARRQALVVLGRDPQRAVDDATFVAGAGDAGRLLAP